MTNDNPNEQNTISPAIYTYKVNRNDVTINEIKLDITDNTELPSYRRCINIEDKFNE